MNKKLLLIVSGISVVLVTLILVFYFQFKGKLFPSPVPQVTPTPMVEEASTWTDPAEFTFQYPKALALNPHNEDEENYAHVELTSATHSGNLIFWVKDTTVTTIDAWITAQKIKNAIDSELDGVPAKKVLTTEGNNKFTLSTVRDGYLYQVEVDAVDNEFWNKIFDQVTASFKFVSSEKTNQQDAAASSVTEGGVEEGSSDEEVIE